MKMIPIKLTQLLLAVLIGALGAFTVSCDDDDDDPDPGSSIVELAQGSADLSSLVSALTRFDDLVSALSGSGSFTVFAPTNTAFTQLLADLDLSSLDEVSDETLRSILQYHVISGNALKAADLSDGQMAETLESGESVTVSIDGATVMIDEATVTSADLEANNGVVHIINSVLLPSSLADPAPTNSIVEIAQATSDLSILVQALTKFPDLVNTLNSAGSYTVFAPTNSAFEALLGVTGQTSLDDIPESVLERVLKYHVIGSGAIASTGLSDGQMAETLLEESVTVAIDGSSVMIDGANVTTADVAATNGFVHIVDAVLVPQLESSIVNTVVEPAYFNVKFQVLTAAVIKAGLLETLIDPDAELTVFAPTDDAFAAANITSLEDLSAEALVPILQYHVLGSKVVAADLPATGSAIPTLNGSIYLSINDDGVFLNGSTEVTTTDVPADNGVVHVIDRTLDPPVENVVEIAVSLSEATEDAEFGQLVAALTAIENDESTAALVTILSSADGTNDAPFTVFAPTDAAFARLYTAAQVEDLDGLVAALGTETIESVLLYHVIAGARVFSTDLPNLTSSDVTMANQGTITLDLANLEIIDTDSALEVGTENASIIGTDVLGTNGVIHIIDQVILP